MALLRIPAGDYILYKTDYQIEAADGWRSRVWMLRFASSMQLIATA